VSATPDQPFEVPGASGGSDPSSPTGLTPEEEAQADRNADRFDIRRLIGALFVLYGVILTLLGIFGSSNVKHKAAGINIDLWTGLGMLVFGCLMIFWALSRPVSGERPDSSGQIGGAAAPQTTGGQ
jgi:hypothetical protein